MACAACEERARLLKIAMDAAKNGNMAEAVRHMTAALGPAWAAAQPKEPPPKP